jgi:hypothetical protein
MFADECGSRIHDLRSLAGRLGCIAALELVARQNDQAFELSWRTHANMENHHLPAIDPCF